MLSIKMCLIFSASDNGNDSGEREENLSGVAVSSAANLMQATTNSSTASGTTNLTVPLLTRANSRKADIEKDVKPTGVAGENDTASNCEELFVSTEPLLNISAQKPSKADVCHATRSSSRIVKRPRRDNSPPTSPVKKGVPCMLFLICKLFFNDCLKKESFVSISTLFTY